MRPASLKRNVGVDLWKDGDQPRTPVRADHLGRRQSTVDEIGEEGPPFRPALGLGETKSITSFLPSFRMPKATSTGRLSVPAPVFLFITIPSRMRARNLVVMRLR